MSFTFEITALIIFFLGNLALGLIAFVHLKTKFDVHEKSSDEFRQKTKTDLEATVKEVTEMKANVDNHHDASKEFWTEVKGKLKEDTANYSDCRLSFSSQINGLGGKVELSEAHHIENKAILARVEVSQAKLETKLDALSERFNTFLSSDFLAVIQGKQGATGPKGLKGPKGPKGPKGLKGLKGD